MRRWFFLGLMALAACSSDEEERAEKQRECDGIEDEIRRAANTRGMPAQGACNAGVSDFEQACTALSRCRRDLADM